MIFRIFLLPVVFLLSQAPTDPDILPYTAKVSFKKCTETNAEQLVKKLIQGKTGDQEKFDAIFSWVTTNIHTTTTNSICSLLLFPAVFNAS